MIGDITIKVCGITRAADAAMCLHLGADWIGVNVWPQSPRHVPAERRVALLREIPAGKRVAIAVNPTVDEAKALLAEGFDAVQAHFDPAEKACDPAALSAAIGVDRLWLAPRLPEGAAFPAKLLPLARTFLQDAHQAGAFGGTGQRADWKRFAANQQAHPGVRWVLAGGLGPETVADAVTAGARFLDLNSQVELSPGLKSAEKLHQVGEVLRKIAQS